jgi:hypothetical protein
MTTLAPGTGAAGTSAELPVVQQHPTAAGPQAQLWRRYSRLSTSRRFAGGYQRCWNGCTGQRRWIRWITGWDEDDDVEAAAALSFDRLRNSGVEPGRSPQPCALALFRDTRQINGSDQNATAAGSCGTRIGSMRRGDTRRQRSQLKRQVNFVFVWPAVGKLVAMMSSMTSNGASGRYELTCCGVVTVVRHDASRVEQTVTL